jgi:hypothetical protein
MAIPFAKFGFSDHRLALAMLNTERASDIIHFSTQNSWLKGREPEVNTAALWWEFSDPLFFPLGLQDVLLLVAVGRGQIFVGIGPGSMGKLVPPGAPSAVAVALAATFQSTCPRPP